VRLQVEYLGHATDPWGNDRAVFSAGGKLNREDWGLTWNMLLETGGLLVDSGRFDWNADGIRERYPTLTEPYRGFHDMVFAEESTTAAFLLRARGLPARIAGGSGAQSPARNATHGGSAGIEIDKIKPGMNKEDLDRVRQEISRLASQAIRGV